MTFLRIALAAAAVLAAAPALHAGPEHEDPRARLALRSGWAEADGRRMAGLTVALAPGWKTYWRVPGEAGVPPHFDWTGSENVAAVTVRFPRPVAFETYGMRTLGYERDVTFPLEVTPEDPDRPVRLALEVLFGLCSDICIPAQASLDLEIAPDAPLAGAAEISAALDAAPVSPEAAGVAYEGCALTGEGEARRVEAVFRLPPGAPTPVAVIEAPAPLHAAPAEARREGDRLFVSAALAGDGWAARDGFRLTLIAPDRAVEAAGCR